MAVTVKHRGKTIELNEKTGEWSCAELALSDTSLPKIKAAIDKDAKEGRKMAVPALLVSGHRYSQHPVKIEDVTITLILETGRRGSCRVKRKGKSGTEQEDLNELYDPAHRNKLTAFMNMHNEALRMEEQADAMLRELDSFTVESVREAMVAKADAET